MPSPFNPDDDIDLGILNDLVGFHIRRASNAFLADFNNSVADTNMRQVLVALLFIIDANPGIYQGRVGEALGIKRGNMVNLANELEERGLVERAPPARNRRALSLTVTDAGRAMIDLCSRRIFEHEDRLLSGIPKKERVALIETLSKITETARAPDSPTKSRKSKEPRAKRLERSAGK